MRAVLRHGNNGGNGHGHGRVSERALVKIPSVHHAWEEHGVHRMKERAYICCTAERAPTAGAECALAAGAERALAAGAGRAPASWAWSRGGC
ncbi:hypothetical protein Dimus_007010 [Dionaea muscipula]